MRMEISAVVLLAALAVGCVSSGEQPGPDYSAELAFAREHAPGSLPGRFTRLDGRAIPGEPMVIRVPVGRHSIEYTCPDVLTLDTYPTVRAEFTAGLRYVLECDADSPGVVRVR